MDWNSEPWIADRNEERSLLEIAQRHWKLVLLCTAALTLCAGLVTLVLPKKYGAEAQFLVKNGRQDLTLSPDLNRAAVAPPVPELTENEVNSEIRLLLSHDLLKNVAVDRKLYVRYLHAGQTEPTPRAVELATTRLAKDLQVSAVRKTNVIETSYRAGSPELAAGVLQDLSKRYLQAHLSAHSTPGSLDFFQQQVDEYRHRLDGAEASTSAFRRWRGIYSVDQQRSALVGQYEDNEAHLRDTGAELKEGRAKLAALTAEEQATPQRLATDQKSAVNPLSVDHLQTEKADLENRRIAMLLKFRPDDRAVKELDQEIGNTTRNLQAAKTEYSAETTTTVNSLHESLVAGLSGARVNIDTLTARQAALEANRAAYLKQLDGFDRDAVALGNLNRVESLDQQGYQFYGERMEAARAANQMDKDNFANVAMIETPSASPIAIWPVMPLNLVIGAFLGLITGFAIAFLLPGDHRRRRAVSTGERSFRGKEIADPVAGD